jgi:hypothetical protein
LDPRFSGAAAAPPRWLFRGDERAWDALAATLATDPSSAVPWPIAPSGPSMAPGDGVLLWRSGPGGGVAASCTVLGEPEAGRDAAGDLTVTVPLRVDRALAAPIAPATLLMDPLLRPLAFMDLLGDTERRVSPTQEAALRHLIDARDRSGVTSVRAFGAAEPADSHGMETRAVDVPVALVPLVAELLSALGGPAPGSAAAASNERGPTSSASAPPASVPSDQLLEQVAALAASHSDGPFTVDDAAAAWRTGSGTARSRIERMLDTGLVERTGDLRPSRQADGRPARGRPPVLYRLRPLDGRMDAVAQREF